MTTAELLTYTDPYPGRKGSERVWESCIRCHGEGWISWFGHVQGGICFECEGFKGSNVLISTVRARERRRVKRYNDSITKKAESEAKQAAWIAENAELVERMNSYLHNSFVLDIAAQAETRPLSERQVAAVVRAMDKMDADKANAVECPEGRYVVTGEVVSTKWDDGPYGSTQKMLVKDDQGFKVYGSIPAALTAIDGVVTTGSVVKPGERVTFTATVERSSRDADFGFFKRPTKASRV